MRLEEEVGSRGFMFKMGKMAALLVADGTEPVRRRN